MPIIIIPGLLRKKEFYQPLADKFIESGYPAEILDLGLNTKNLEETSKILLNRLIEIKEKVDIVAHSYGGIILKNTIKRLRMWKKHLVILWRCRMMPTVSH